MGSNSPMATAWTSERKRERQRRRVRDGGEGDQIGRSTLLQLHMRERRGCWRSIPTLFLTLICGSCLLLCLDSFNRPDPWFRDLPQPNRTRLRKGSDFLTESLAVAILHLHWQRLGLLLPFLISPARPALWSNYYETLFNFLFVLWNLKFFLFSSFLVL